MNEMDWKDIKDSQQRKKVQNRLAQRRRRQRLKIGERERAHFDEDDQNHDGVGASGVTDTTTKGLLDMYPIGDDLGMWESPDGICMAMGPPAAERVDGCSYHKQSTARPHHCESQQCIRDQQELLEREPTSFMDSLNFGDMSLFPIADLAHTALNVRTAYNTPATTVQPDKVENGHCNADEVSISPKSLAGSSFDDPTFREIPKVTSETIADVVRSTEAIPDCTCRTRRYSHCIPQSNIKEATGDQRGHGRLITERGDGSSHLLGTGGMKDTYGSRQSIQCGEPVQSTRPVSRTSAPLTIKSVQRPSDPTRTSSYLPGGPKPKRMRLERPDSATDTSQSHRYLPMFDTVNETSTQIPRADRFDPIFDAMSAAGFDSFDDMASEYYTANFQGSSPVCHAQYRSRVRNLRRFLAKLNASARNWNDVEQRGWAEEIIESAEVLYAQEMKRALETIGAKSSIPEEPSLHLQIPNIWALFTRITLVPDSSHATRSEAVRDALTILTGSFSERCQSSVC